MYEGVRFTQGTITTRFTTAWGRYVAISRHFSLHVALDVHARLYGSMQRISSHTAYLAKRVYEGLSSFQHYNGVPMCRIYKESSTTYGNNRTQCATIAFNMQEPESLIARLTSLPMTMVYMSAVAGSAILETLLRILIWSHGRWREHILQGTSVVSPPISYLANRPALSGSIGVTSTKFDVDKFLDFIRRTFAVVRDLNTTQYTSANSMLTMEQEVLKILNPVDLFMWPCYSLALRTWTVVIEYFFDVITF